MRKLFVNAARIYPQECLNLITTCFSALSTPLSTAAFPPTEAALKLVFAFGDSGTPNLDLVKNGAFPALLTALHESDIGNHPHVQVRLAYYDIAARYVKFVPVAGTHRAVESLVSQYGMRCSLPLVRCRAAYFFLKIVDGMNEKAAALLPLVGSFSGKI
jgi:hypothetical protein